MKKTTPSLIGTFFLLQLSLFSVAFAEITATISLVPVNPAPKSQVTLTLESYSFDVNTAMITWSSNDRVVLKGQGEKSLVVKTGNVGESNVITVTSETSDGSTVTQSITITPSSVTLLFEAPNSYVPLMYEGKVLPSTGGLIRVTAMPQISDSGVFVSPSSLSYSWYINDVFIQQASGRGKQSADIRLDYLRNKNEVKVIVRSPGGNTGTKTITVYDHAILPLLYSYDPVLGSNLSSAIEKRFEAVKDFTLSLEPFYLSQKERKEPTFSWFLDGVPSTPFGGRVLSLQPKENSYGTKMLSITVLGPDKRIQQAETRLELIFDTRK